MARVAAGLVAVANDPTETSGRSKSPVQRPLATVLSFGSELRWHRSEGRSSQFYHQPFPRHTRSGGGRSTGGLAGGVDGAARAGCHCAFSRLQAIAPMITAATARTPMCFAGALPRPV